MSELFRHWVEDFEREEKQKANDLMNGIMDHLREGAEEEERKRTEEYMSGTGIFRHYIEEQEEK